MFYKFKQTLKVLKQKGLIGTINIIYYYFKIRKIRKNLAYQYIKGQGIEIGGLINPNPVNHKTTKVKYVDYLDEESLKKNYNNELAKTDLQKIDYICKADNLDKINSDSQDFVIGNHLFEHLNNPIKALLERHRVIKKGGIVFMAIPDKRRTFDEKRERTTLDHIISDYISPSEERDREHYIQYAGIKYEDPKEIEKEAKRLKLINYSIHYHVFLEEDVLEIINRCNNNTYAKFDTFYVKHTAKNLGDNEFILILKIKK
ncbi:Methyltransferase type 11 [candidate division SR1 bacterium RAAC1_SR1_1]|nr:Methyltransferase type 11 [candidate division SR1 bacterium RAAC1_SR1_1]